MGRGTGRDGDGERWRKMGTEKDGDGERWGRRKMGTGTEKDGDRDGERWGWGNMGTERAWLGIENRDGDRR